MAQGPEGQSVPGPPSDAPVDPHHPPAGRRLPPAAPAASLAAGCARPTPCTSGGIPWGPPQHLWILGVAGRRRCHAEPPKRLFARIPQASPGQSATLPRHLHLQAHGSDQANAPAESSILHLGTAAGAPATSRPSAAAAAAWLSPQQAAAFQDHPPRSELLMSCCRGIAKQPAAFPAKLSAPKPAAWARHPASGAPNPDVSPELPGGSHGRHLKPRLHGRAVAAVGWGATGRRAGSSAWRSPRATSAHAARPGRCRDPTGPLGRSPAGPHPVAQAVPMPCRAGPMTWHVPAAAPGTRWRPPRISASH
mmetsp:Transcript_70672/g.111874  ORF Transcript_70672/g.111874 Transcript_70672/m.111874 type:complete len:307 (+) Transcript_70672:1770-2690(+)